MSNNQVRISLDKLNNIGDALREKRGEDTQYTLDEMPEAIRSIEGGGGEGEMIHLIDPQIQVGITVMNSQNITITEVIPA